MKLFVLVISSFYLSLPTAANSFSITAPNEPGWANKENTGFTQELTKRISSNLPGVNLKVHPEPLKRSLQSFISFKYDCFFGGNAKDFHTEYKLDFIESVPYYKREFFHFAPTTPKKKLETVGLMRGLKKEWFSNYLEIKHLKVIYFKNMKQAGKLLNQGRIDSIISAGDIKVLASMKLEKVTPANIMPGNDTIVCHANSKNRALIKKLNIEIPKNKAFIDNHLQKVYLED
jgi:hypothetical protein